MSNNKESEYDVGYARRPQRSQFRKGTSGNPKGRPRGSRNLATELEEALSKKVAIVENGKRRKITMRGATIKQLVNKAASGDLRAARQLFDLEMRVNPEGVRQPSMLDVFRSIADEVRKQKTIEKAGPQEIEELNDHYSESETAANSMSGYGKSE